jgi:hypothetical protein
MIISIPLASSHSWIGQGPLITNHEVTPADMIGRSQGKQAKQPLQGPASDWREMTGQHGFQGKEWPAVCELLL